VWLSACLPDSLDLGPCLSILFWISTCEQAGSRDFAFLGAVEMSSLQLRYDYDCYKTDISNSGEGMMSLNWLPEALFLHVPLSSRVQWYQTLVIWDRNTEYQDNVTMWKQVKHAHSWVFKIFRLITVPNTSEIAAQGNTYKWNTRILNLRSDFVRGFVLLKIVGFCPGGFCPTLPKLRSFCPGFCLGCFFRGFVRGSFLSVPPT